MKMPPDEHCPKCRALNSRVHSELTVQGHVIADDYCGRCGRNWPRPEPPKPSRSKVIAMKDRG